VSIIIPTVVRADLLFDCLASIAAHVDPAAQYEVIVVVNDTADAARRIAARVEGVAIHATGANVGFAAACNAGVRLASGTFLVLLNDDTRVRPGWLEALVATARSRPGVGAVGSRMLFPDGRLQEAGSLVWADGSTIGIGRLAMGHERTAARRVAYCSACSLLVPRHAWLAAGGLDEGYHPAYYEDVDFCLRLQALGLDVVYAPGSVVEHHEASSSDPDYRLFLFAWNKQRLARKWRSALGAFEPATPGRTARAEWLAAGTPRRLLIVDDTWPDATAGSGLPRMGDSIREMVEAGWAVDLWASVPQPAPPPLALACECIDGSLAERLESPDHTYDVVVLSRPLNFAAWHERVRARQPQAALVYDGEALFHVRIERQVALAAPAERPALEADADRMRSLETGIRAAVDAVVCVSAGEAAIFDASPGAAPVHLMLPLVSAARPTDRPFAQRRGAAFVAGWLGGERSPNVDALRWFHDEVLPGVLERIPDFQLFVTGRHPPGSILRLNGPHVVFLGVVADLHDVYDRVRVSVVPTRIGAGVKNKFVEALQYGVPVVSTTIGAEGVSGWIGAACVADDPRGFAAALAELCLDESSWLTARRAAARTDARWKQEARGWGPLLDDVHAARARTAFAGAERVASTGLPAGGRS
jgi:GT2 family glycosyltransferase